MKPILLDLPFPIKTPRLVLRPPTVGDGRVVNAAILESLDTLRQYMPWAKEAPSVNDSEEFVRQGAANWILKRNEEPYLPLFIFTKNDNQFVGGTGFHHYDWEIPSIETGYWIRTRCAGVGLMTEAINAITQYAFRKLNVKRISITCESNNTRSKKIPERLGYQLEATLKANRRNLVTGEISDTLIYTRYDLEELPALQVNWI